jgi:hypothetical protein
LILRWLNKLRNFLIICLRNSVIVLSRLERFMRSTLLIISNSCYMCILWIIRIRKVICFGHCRSDLLWNANLILRRNSVSSLFWVIVCIRVS